MSEQSNIEKARAAARLKPHRFKALPEGIRFMPSVCICGAYRDDPRHDPNAPLFAVEPDGKEGGA